MTEAAAHTPPGLQTRAVLAIGALLALLTVGGAGLLLWHDRQSDIAQWQQTAANLSATLAEHAEQTRARRRPGAAKHRGAAERRAHRQRCGVLAGRWIRPAIHEVIRNKVAAVPQVDVASIIDRHGEYHQFHPLLPALCARTRQDNG